MPFWWAMCRTWRGDATWDAPGPWIDARAAVYVIGSDKMGGMEADEFVPFSIEADAQAFVARHGGEMRRFDDIQTDDVLAPSAPIAAGDDDDIAGRLSTLSGQKGTN